MFRRLAMLLSTVTQPRTLAVDVRPMIPEDRDRRRACHIQVLLLFVVGCASAESDSPATLAREWIENWREVRQCLVADAEDVRTGLAMSQLVGRDCSKRIGDLARGLPDESSIAPLVSQQSSLSLRAKAVARLDAVALQHGQFVAAIAPARSLPTLRGVHSLFAGQDVAVARFNGGMVTGTRPTDQFISAAIGDERRISIETGATLAIPSRRWSVSAHERPLAAADAGLRKVVVRRSGRSYAIDTSVDDGRRWTTRTSNATVVDHWQDTRTGVIELLVRDRNDVLLGRRIDPRNSRTEEWVADSSASLNSADVECENGGARWSLDGDRVARFAERALTLHGSARDGQMDCRGQSALVLRRNPDVIERCHQHCWEVFVPPEHLRGSAALLDDGRWLYVAAREDVVAVWIESRDPYEPTPGPRFYRLPTSAPIVGLTVLSGRPALVTSDNGYALVPLK